MLRFSAGTMKALPEHFAACIAGGMVASAILFPAQARCTEKKEPSAQVTVHAAHEACEVELDAVVAGKTDAHGVLAFHDVEPGDHYIHVRCPGEPEAAYYVLARVGRNIDIGGAAGTPAPPASADAPLELAGTRIELREHLQQAIQLRAKGRLEEAVRNLRAAIQLDPENSDLHRELGITFLLGKDWKRARVEMLEAVRHDPTNADAHNGLGYALEKLGKLAEALKEYRTASRLDPDDPGYRQHYVDALGKVYAQQNLKKK